MFKTDSFSVSKALEDWDADLLKYLTDNFCDALNVTEVRPDNLHHFFDGLNAHRVFFATMGYDRLTKRMDQYLEIVYERMTLEDKKQEALEKRQKKMLEKQEKLKQEKLLAEQEEQERVLREKLLTEKIQNELNAAQRKKDKIEISYECNNQEDEIVEEWIFDD